LVCSCKYSDFKVAAKIGIPVKRQNKNQIVNIIIANPVRFVFKLLKKILNSELKKEIFDSKKNSISFIG